MYINRDNLLKQLIDRKENGSIKVITGIRRCGKSFLLFKIFKNYLLANGVNENQIIEVSLDDIDKAKYRNPLTLSKYIKSRIKNKSKIYYIFIDEIQYAISKKEKKNDVTINLYDALNGFLKLDNVDIYVTGSNSKMLTKDVLTSFRGRGDAVEVHPLTFKEYYDFVKGDVAECYEEYAIFGGMPAVLQRQKDSDKRRYLNSLFEEIYFKDISERYAIDLPEVLTELTDVICSSIGSLTNALKLSNSLASVKQIKVSSNTIATYLEYLQESFLFHQAKRFDVKGKKYFSFPVKYYCTDIGLRNARLNLRQQEESHIMENIVFNELVSRGYAVDVGVVEFTNKASDGLRHKSTCEIDFIVNKGMNKNYIQLALNLDSPEKSKQELRPLLAVKDFFKKIIITKTRAKPWIDNNGIIHIGIYDFLLNDNILD